MPTSQPKWLVKLIDIWDRRDTAGFYELQELISSLEATVRSETLEDYQDYLKSKTIKGTGNDDPGLYRLLNSYLESFKDLKAGGDKTT